MKGVVAITVAIAASTSALFVPASRIRSQGALLTGINDLAPCKIEIALSSSISDEGVHDVPTETSSFVGRMKKAFALSRGEASINLVQLSAFLIAASLIRVQSIARWTANRLRRFPHDAMLDYEGLSAANWILHFSILAYNIGIFRSMFRIDDETSDAKKKRSYAIAAVGLNHVFAGVAMLSHSLIGTAFTHTGQALHNFSTFLLTLSVMSVGGLMLLPALGGALFATTVGFFIMNGLVSMQNTPGILLATLGLLAVVSSPDRDFPLQVKMGYGMLSMTPLVTYLIERYVVNAGTDLGHMMVAAWILLVTIFQRSALLERAANE